MPLVFLWNRLPHHFIVQFSRIQHYSAGFSHGVRKVVEEVAKHITYSKRKTYALWLQDCAHCAAEGRAEGQDLLGPRKLWLKWKATCFNSKLIKFGYRLYNLSGVCCIILGLTWNIWSRIVGMGRGVAMEREREREWDVGIPGLVANDLGVWSCRLFPRSGVCAIVTAQKQ